MVTIRLSGKLTEDRQSVVDVPDDIPAGDVQVVLEIAPPSPALNEATIRARAKLAAAGVLSTIWEMPVDVNLIDLEDELIELPPGLSIDEIVSQDRDEH